MKAVVNYLKNWDWIRVVRLLIGIFILAEGVRAGIWMFVIMGGLFSLMPLLNIGCSADGSCRVPVRRRSSGKEEVTFEEVK